MKDALALGCDEAAISCGQGQIPANNHRFPNGATHHSDGITQSVRLTRGTETSKYPEEKKTTVIAQVVASERAGAQTVPVTAGAGL